MAIICSVVVSFNGEKWIRKCLDSLKGSSVETRIIVVDNHSVDNTISIISTDYPEIDLFQLPENLGFGAANNIGIKKAIEWYFADHVFLLNQDASVVPDTIQQLLEQIELNNKCGLAIPVHLNGSGDDLDSYFREYLKKGNLDVLLRAAFVKKEITGWPTIVEVPFANAAAWLLKRACLLEVGGFDPLFFHYGEDQHFMQRMKFFGWTAFVVLSSKIFHDRDIPLNRKQQNLAGRIRFDQHNYLIRLADVNKSLPFRGISIAIIRHFIKALVAGVSFNGEAVLYESSMFKKAILSAYPIVRSHRCSRKKQMLFLDLNKSDTKME